MEGKIKETLLFWLAILSGISAIVGLIVILCTDKNKVIIALIAIIIFLIALLLSVWYTISKIVHKEHDKDYLKLSFFTKYEYLDKTHIAYDG